jgi:hypothetical protein
MTIFSLSSALSNSLPLLPKCICSHLFPVNCDFLPIIMRHQQPQSACQVNTSFQYFATQESVYDLQIYYLQIFHNRLEDRHRLSINLKISEDIDVYRLLKNLFCANRLHLRIQNKALSYRKKQLLFCRAKLAWYAQRLFVQQFPLCRAL